MSPPDLSLVIPILDERASIRKLHRQVDQALASIGKTWEIIFVDDGSTDGGPEEIRTLCEKDNRVGLVQLARNYGKSVAYMAGMDHARASILITMDGDLQDDPREIPRFLEALDQGADLVVGWKKNRMENEPAKKLASFVYHVFKNHLFTLRLHDSNCGFRAMRRPVARSLNLYGGKYRFIPELAHMEGFEVCEIPVRHRPRNHGQSKYGPMRFWTGTLDLISVRFLTGFSARPLHFFGTAGLVSFLAGGALETYVLIARILGSTFRTHLAAMIIGALFIMVGVQLIATGLVCEMIRAQGNRVRYQVAESFGSAAQSQGERMKPS